MFAPMRPGVQGRVDSREFEAQTLLMGPQSHGFLICATVLVLAGQAWGGGEDAASARLRAFERELLASPSATATLNHWCADHHLAEPPRIVALRRSDVQKPPSAEVRRQLGADPSEAILYRRVDLVCGALVLSQADNWYRPALLTPEMNRRLENTQTPFGQVVAAMDFHRQTLGVSRPTRRDRSGDPSSPIILRVRALLVSGAGAPFALVQESYTRAILSEGR
jgi:hypothetical protein